MIVVAVPSRSFTTSSTGCRRASPVLSLVKGLDPVDAVTGSRRSHDRPVAVLSGPNHAEEIADGLPPRP